VTHSKYSDTDIGKFREIYATDGVVHVPGLLDPGWVRDLTQIIEDARVTLTPDHARSPMDHFVAVPDDTGQRYRVAEYSYSPGRFTIRWLWRDLDPVRRFFTESNVAPLVAAVIGARRLQYWYDLTFLQEPLADGPGSPWHHDIAAFPCKGQQIPSLWIAMSDIDRDMSPLECIRGSHKDPRMFRPPVHLPEGTATPAGYSPAPDVESLIGAGTYERITWDIKAGDALLIHPFTLHGAPANRSNKVRIAFTTRWAGDDVVWKPDVFSMRVPGVDLTQVPVGQRPDGPYFPYAL
jgi:ectoine hydroxylase-related dioxygenase (phytanoyl-CoA dioxygenase family)